MRQVLVVAKGPSPRRSKTRLVPPLEPAEAAALQGALLLDTLDGCRAEADTVGLLYADPEEAAELTALVGPETELVLQEGRGLRDALRIGLARRLPHGPTAIVASDIPGVPAGAIAQAFAELDRGVDVVLGPAADGGYWLIAMREHDDAPFHDIPWSTPAVLAVTRRRCEEAGLRVAEVAAWRDVDTAVDLAFLAPGCEHLPAPRTRDVLRGLSIPEPPPARLVASELLDSSPWRAVVSDALALDGGRTTTYTYLATPRAVFVVPVTTEGELLLVRQYRHPVRDWTLEVPAGSVEDGEHPLEAAQRELAEEVGGRAPAWRHLTTFYSSSAHVSLRSDAFLATGVEVHAARPDDDEDVALVRLPVPAAIERARRGGFLEGQTALAILLAAPYLEEGWRIASPTPTWPSVPVRSGGR
jgi:rSAM/selenodomain-associated transferase 1